jgi:hypothetical protein
LRGHPNEGTAAPFRLGSPKPPLAVPAGKAGAGGEKRHRSQNVHNQGGCATPAGVPTLRAGRLRRAGGDKRHRSQNTHNQSATADLFGDEGPLGVVVPRRQECRRYGRASGGAGGEKRNRSHNIHNQSATADLFGDEGPLGVVVPRRQECRRYGRASAGGAVKSDTKFRTSTTSPRRRTCLATRDRSGWLCHVGRSAGATAGLRGRSWMVNVVLWGGVFRAWESLCHTGKVPALRRVGTFTTTNGCATTA